MPGLPSRLELFAAAPPGLEALVAADLADLGVHGARVVVGGVEVVGDAALLARLNLELRCAHRVLWRLGVFQASKLPELRRKIAMLPWALVCEPKARVRVRATCHGSRIYHSGAAAERTFQGIADALGDAIEPAVAASPKGGREEELDTDALVVVVRIARNEVTVSVDSSGEHLHRRGYRLRVAKAPLRETLAASCLRLCGWPAAGEAFLDRMCGSGTLVIEAALAAAGMAPGLGRSFACERWPAFDAAVLARARDAARARVRPVEVVLAGADRDAGAVEAARENAERAGVASFVRIEHRVISEARPVGDRGLLLTNPPYGARLGEVMRLRDLYASLGNVYRRHFAGWRLALLASSPRLVQAAGLPLETLGPVLDNGGLKVRLNATLNP